MSKPMLTIFTPTYNRAHTLERLYQSLCAQSVKDFEWLLVDDGSTDSTRDLVLSWMEQKIFSIRYIYQENSGKSQAHNEGVAKAKGKLFTCVDSDDYLTEDAVEKILHWWEQNEGIVGIVCGRGYSSQNPITLWNGEVERAKLIDAYRKYSLRGDTMLVYDTKVIQRYSFPYFKGEKFVPESYLYDQLDDEGELFITNEVIYIGEYLEDGYTKSMAKVIAKNPKGYEAYILQRLTRDRLLKYKIQDTIRYVAIKLCLKDQRLLKDSVYPLLTILTYPIGYFLYARRYK